MRTLLIHIGAPKCASTFLQRTLLNSADEIRTETDFEFLHHSSFHHRPFMRFLRSSVSTGNVRKGWPTPERMRELRQDFTDLVATTSRDRVFLSNEAFLGSTALHKYGSLFPNSDLVARYLSELLDDSIEVKISLVVRRQDTFLESCFSQRYREGETPRGDEFLEAIDLNRLSWLKVASAFAGVFGEDNTYVVPFEMVQDDDIGFIEAVLSPLSSGALPPLKKAPNNKRGFSAKAMEIARAVYPLLDNPKDLDSMRAFLGRNFTTLTHEKPRLLSAEQRRAIMSTAAQHNRELFSRYTPGVNIDRYSEGKLFGSSPSPKGPLALSTHQI